MDSSFPIAHRHMLAYEGGYSNHPADPGGVTLEGVIQRVYDDYRRSKGLPKKTLTASMRGTPSWTAERDEIYRSRYWLPPSCPRLEPGVDAAIYDYSVNSGPGRASKVLQRLVGVGVDGKVGPETVAAANRRDAKVLAAAICDERLAFLKGLRHWPTFRGGWSRRVADVRNYTAAMAMDLPVSEPAQIDMPVARGEVPEPKAAKNTVKGTAGAGGAGGAASLWDWIVDNPLQSVLIAIIIVGVAAIAIRIINNWWRSKQETPTPGFDAIPEMQAAT